MKVFIHTIRALALASFFSIFASCDDDFNTLGGSVQDPEQTISIVVDTFDISLSTHSVDGIYLYTANDLIGSFTDNLYGSLDVDFLAQLYPSVEITFEDSINLTLKEKGYAIDSLVLAMKYLSYVGDSLSPMQLSVYELNKQLPSRGMTNTNPLDYYDPNNSFLGRRMYTAAQVSLPDSVRKDEDYVPTVTVKLDDQLRDRFNKAYKEDKTLLTNNIKFKNFFKGIFVKNSYGNGAVLNLEATNLRAYYQKQPNDTTILTTFSEYFIVSNEAVNINHIKNTSPSYMTQANSDTAYVKAPAGLYTQVTFPTQQIMEVLKNNAGNFNVTINALQFSVPIFTPEQSYYGITPPDYLLFIRASQTQEFFEQQKQVDGRNYIVAKYNSSSKSYNFGNINAFLSNIISLNPDTVITSPDIINLIPVQYTSTNTSNKAVHLTRPSLVKIDAKNVKTSLVFSKRN